MRKCAQLLLALALGFVLTSSQETFAQGRNEISGTVFSELGRPLADISIELVSDLGTSLTRIRTNASGRFTFVGLTNGTYRVRILPYGTEYKEQTQEVTLSNISTTSSDRQQIEIYLRLNERAKSGPFAIVTGVVFAQDVPREAQKLYEDGVRYLAEKKETEGLGNLKKAIEAFPTYYAALDRLGGEYAIRGNTDRSYLEAAFVLLTKASEINPKGFSSVFGLGLVQYQLGLNDGAIESLRRATTLYGKAADAYLWLGKALKRAATLDQAEAAFKRANELTNGKSAEVHWQTAGLYHDMKRYKEAADELELFLKAQPNSNDANKIRELIRQLREKAAKEQSE
jgi:tetratricopeptide (TPR) repeat protein